MSGTLHVVATPIGNLEDITLRALRVLREVAIVAAEDTRHTAKLLAHHGIPTRTISFHQHNSRTRTSQLLDRLIRGESIALVTDAGTPGVSDPGTELVRACVDAAIAVNALPGASAPLSAAVLSGFPLEPLTILGFAPARGAARTRWFHELSAAVHTTVFFETPHRIQAALTSMADVLGDRPIVLCRELTKVHQEVLRGAASSLADGSVTARGEFTVVVGPADKGIDKNALPDADTVIAAEFGELTNSTGMGRREAIALIAKRTARPAREIYTAIERTKAAAGSGRCDD